MFKTKLRTAVGTAILYAALAPPPNLYSPGISTGNYTNPMAMAEAWQSMGPDLWDKIDLKSRKQAYERMMGHFVDLYGFGRDSNIPKKDFVGRFKAMNYVESRLNHRAVSPTDDKGLSQLSKYARTNLPKMRWEGVNNKNWKFDPEKAFYPYENLRGGMLWFGILLKESKGDLDMATMAYNKGMRNAMKGRAKKYLIKVKDAQAKEHLIWR